MKPRLLAASFAALSVVGQPVHAQYQKPAKAPGSNEYSIEGQLSSYKYKEPDLMDYKGPRAAVAGRMAHVGERNVFTAGEAKLSYGRLDYSSNGSGTMNDVPDYYYEFRALVGKRIPSGAATYAPYLGFGWRHLINDSEGMTTTTGAGGYRRISDYYYLPLGIDWRYTLSGGYLEANAEFDFLLRGTQRSNILGGEVKNTQNRGHGFRASALWGSGRWAAGPFVGVWKIAKSNEDVCGGGFYVCWEPKNETTEAGLRVRYSFQ